MCSCCDLKLVVLTCEFRVTLDNGFIFPNVVRNSDFIQKPAALHDDNMLYELVMSEVMVFVSSVTSKKILAAKVCFYCQSQIYIKGIFQPIAFVGFLLAPRVWTPMSSLLIDIHVQLRGCAFFFGREHIRVEWLSAVTCVRAWSRRLQRPAGSCKWTVADGKSVILLGVSVASSNRK